MPEIDYNLVEVPGMQAGNIPLLFRARAMLRLVPAAYGEPIPPGERAIVTDISFWQASANFDVMKLAGARAVVAKCTQGTTIFDSKYNTYVNDCDEMPLGSYHFMSNSNGTAQADWYTSHLRPHMIPLMHWGDVEVNGIKSSYIYQWAVRVKNNLGMADYSKIGIYTSAYMWSLVVDDGYKAWIANNLVLWVAHYGVDAPLLPAGWTTYVLHQYTPKGDGHLYGVESLNIDLDRCRKSWLAQFESPAHDSWAWDVTNGLRSLGQTVRDPE